MAVPKAPPPSMATWRPVGRWTLCFMVYGLWVFPYAPCMVYLPTKLAHKNGVFMLGFIFQHHGSHLGLYGIVMAWYGMIWDDINLIIYIYGFLLWYTLVLGESQFSIAMLNYQRVWFMGIVSLYLVGGFNHLEKWWTSSVGMIIPIDEMEKKMSQTTNQGIVWYCWMGNKLYENPRNITGLAPLWKSVNYPDLSGRSTVTGTVRWGSSTRIRYINILLVRLKCTRCKKSAAKS